LRYLENNFTVRFFYQDAWFNKDSINVRFSNHTLAEAMDIMLRNKPYTYRIISKNQIVFLPRAEVAILAGQIPNYSNNNGSETDFTLIGNLNEAGRSKTAAVSGTVIDGKTGDPVIGATIQIQNLQQGVVSNTEGFYKLMLSPGLYTLLVSSVGYEAAQFHIKVVSSGEYTIEIFDKSVRFDDIVIYGQRLDKNISSHQMSLVELNINEMGQLPSVAGGKDILKGLTIMPGVKSIGEFSSGINVRGGGEDQNLYLVNSAPLFYTTHIFGLISVINPDMVDRLSLYKGHIPAGFGERVSSVIDIKTHETLPEKFGIRGGVGLYDSRLMIELPVVKDKLFFNFGGRTSYSNWILKAMKDYDLNKSKASFYDLNGSLRANFGKNRIALSAYISHDEFRFSSDVRYRYGSNMGSLNWNYLFNSSLASYLTLAYSEYNVDKDALVKKNRITSGIQYGSLKYHIQYGGWQNHNLDAGFNLIGYRIQPGKRRSIDGGINTPATLGTEQGYEGGLYVNDEIIISPHVLLNLGLRYSAYANTGPGSVASYMPDMPSDSANISGVKEYGRNEIIKFYHGFEPRLSARIKINDRSSLKMSYNRNIQYISMITFTNVSTPSDIWKLSDPFIKPLIANQYAVGYYRNFFNNTIEASVEAYFKDLTNVVEFEDGAQLEMNKFIEAELVNASGVNYGVEFLLKKNAGKFDGWFSYTYSRSLRKTQGIYAEEIVNDNRYYPSSYDKPHDLSVIANYHLNKRLRFSANFSYATGRPIALPENYYFNMVQSETSPDMIPIFSDRNKYRIPRYHRLDISISLDESLKLRKKWKGSWTFSILNVYGRKNPYTLYYKKEDPSPVNNYKSFNLYMLYLIGRPVPTLSYTFNF